ncbi:MAG TPA: RNA 3'-terminal phosphate cyclase [Bryobacteraceae bacterium]|nr:RNA 3'-terminal phosphate cyclase [Bryobacteraceae bacterium]
MIRIDGSFGEGGGQILRTSLSLSLATGKAFRIQKIRAGRERPGLLRQHLTAVLAAAEVGGAEVQGATLGSTELTFSPGPIHAGEYRFSVGTAGSGTLVFQTVLPALMLAPRMTQPGPSRIVIEGGTHNTAAPPFDFLARTFLPLLERMGPRVLLEFERYGFYPAGGGRFCAEIHPVKALKALDIAERGEIISRRAIGIVANLPRHIAQREVETVGKMLNWGPETFSVEESRNSAGPGNIVMIEIGSSEVTEIFSAFGQVALSAEKVASIAAREARQYLVSRAAAGEHLTDQLLLPLALAGSGSFTAAKINLHAHTNMEVISEFLPVRFEIREEDGFVRVSVAE